ncbi:hypothetical protein KVR01_008879 [Diaporthe batatas]|uniref:uncharacterized protein n=1 Tax=Diaporthe batatas TaxID=748121 RepID=UPI001D03C872|nr:uncharacterized protein KVR01_008879 [Diaporthe batatas]KAG8160615.1 hypothetical protein KVR01_008879 [Diaporthe batatas]
MDHWLSHDDSCAHDAEPGWQRCISDIKRQRPKINVCGGCCWKCIPANIGWWGESRSPRASGISPDHHLIEAFARDVRRRKEQPPGHYDDFIDLAASAAVRVLIYGPHTPEEREDPLPLMLYRKMLYLVKHALPETKSSSEKRPQPAGEKHDRADGDDELDTAKRQQLLGGAYESGFSAGLEAGARAEASRRQVDPADIEGAYAQGFAAGQRRLMNSEIAFAFARGQEAEKERVRACLGEIGEQESQLRQILENILGETAESDQPLRHRLPESASTTKAPAQHSRHYSSRGSDSSHVSPPARSSVATAPSDVWNSSIRREPTPDPASERRATLPGQRRGRRRSTLNETEGRNAVATCVFCGIQLSQNSILRHKRRHHPAELAAVGVPLRSCPCWWPGCGQLQDNLVHGQLTSHLQRKHNFSPPGDSNAFTENIKFLRRMPMNLQISIVAEAAQQLNAVKLRIQDLEAQLRRVKPAYVSRHRLPDVHCLHESRPPVLSAILHTRARLPYIIQELRQLTRARGMRSQLRDDEGTWWEVADDLEAGLNPSGKLAQAVAALPPPGGGATIHLNANTFSEAPNMNDPSWKPQYAVPFQAGWEVNGLDDNNPVWTRAGPGARGGTSAIADRPIKNEPEDDEEDGSYRDLVAEISRRALIGNTQSDWDDNGSDEVGDESADTEDDTARDDGLDRSNGTKSTPGKRKMSATMSPSPRTTKSHRVF